MQENEKIIRVRKEGAQPIRTRRIWQYDKGHVLVFEDFGLPETFQVHFAQSADGEARPWVGQNDTCRLPDAYTQSSGTVYAWVYVADLETGLTKCQIEIPVESRGENTDEEPTPVQESALDQAIAALNDGVTRAEAAQAAAEGAQAGAERYAESAGDSAITAGDAARAAAASETAAAGSASAADASARDALASREGADQSASAAGVSERAAKASETAAAGSASAAVGSASAAAGSASQAAGYASTATDNARAAAGSATAADTSARAAAGSAADAQQSAGAAAAIAQGAAASAAAADGSATEAAGSATAAAGSATSAGQSATAAAGSASDAAEIKDYLDENYGEISDDVNSLKSAFNAHEQYAEETYAKQDGYYSDMAVGTAEQLVSSKFVEDQEPYTLRASGGSADIGNRENLKAVVGGTLAWNQQVRDEASDNVTDFADIVTVDDAVADNAGVQVKIEPVQDLHGYDHPWPAGGNGNLIDIATCTASAAGNIVPVTALAQPIPAGEYTVGITSSAAIAWVLTLYDDSNNSVGAFSSNDALVGRQVKTFTTTATATKGKVYVNGATTLSNFMFESGSVAHDYVPYSNICPISGWDAVKVSRAGKNLYDSNADTYNCYINENGAIGSSASWRISDYIRIKDVVWYKGITNAGIAPRSAWYDENKRLISLFKQAIGTNSIAPPAGAKYVRFSINVDANEFIVSNASITDYEPYSGQTYDITIPSEAGTVYGGSLTVNKDGTGSMIVNKKTDTLNGSETWTLSQTTENYIRFQAIPSDIKNGENVSKPDILADKFQSSGNVAWGIAHYQNRLWLFFPPEINTVALAQEWLSENNTQIVYELEEPIVFTLSASQVQTLLGTNNVWADAGQLSLTYKGTDEHLILTDGRKYLTRIDGVDSMVLGAGQALTAVKGRDNVFDLTQMFGAAAVADYVYGQGASFFRKWFPNSVYAYNPGELKSVEGLQSHDTVGFNQFNETILDSIAGVVKTADGWTLQQANKWGMASTEGWENLRYVKGHSYCATVDYTTQGTVGARFEWVYTDGSYTLPTVAKMPTGREVITVVSDPTKEISSLHFNYGSGGSFPLTVHSICINLSNSGSRNGEYEPYEKHSYPLDSSLTLRGIPKAGANGIYWDGDRYLPDGTVERRYGVVDLGTLEWLYNTSAGVFVANSLQSIIKSRNAVCNIYPVEQTASTATTIANAADMTMLINKGSSTTGNFREGAVIVKNSKFTDAAAFKSAMSGVLLVYELVTQTIETAEPYRELQIVDDWGTEEFVTDGLVPVGHETQYPANLRDKLQHLPDLASSNGIYIVKQTYSEMELMRLPDMPTENGNYRLKLNVASGSPTFSWEVVT